MRTTGCSRWCQEPNSSTAGSSSRGGCRRAEPERPWQWNPDQVLRVARWAGPGGRSRRRLAGVPHPHRRQAPWPVRDGEDTGRGARHGPARLPGRQGVPGDQTSRPPSRLSWLCSLVERVERAVLTRASEHPRAPPRGTAPARSAAVGPRSPARRRPASCTTLPSLLTVFVLHNVVTGRYFRGRRNTVEYKVVVAGLGAVRPVTVDAAEQT